MNLLRHFCKWGSLLVLGLAATGCVIAPLGRYGRGHRHYAPPAGAHAGAVDAPVAYPGARTGR